MRRKTLVAARAMVVVSAGCGGTRSSGGNDTAATPGTVSSGVNSTATTRAEAVKFAECMRANGVSAFPDPVNGQPLVDTTRIPSSNKPGGMTILNAAMHKCGHFVAEQTGGR